MSSLVKSLYIFVGAGLGGNARYWIGGFIQSKFAPLFPYGTLVINASGSLLIGLVIGLLANSLDPLPWRLLVVVGFLGGYTTFSSFSLETVNLISGRNYGLAAIYAFGSLVSGVLGAWVGLVLANMWMSRGTR